MQPVVQKAALASEARTEAADRARSLSRNVSALAANFDATSRSFLTRLKDFGIAEHPTIAFKPVENPLKPTTTRRRSFLGASYFVQAYRNDTKIRIDEESDACGEHAQVKPDNTGTLTVPIQRAAFFTAKVAGRTLSLLGGGCMAGSMGESDPVRLLFDSQRRGMLHPITSGVPLWEIRNPGGACEGAACDYHVVISHERYLLIWSNYSAAIELVDLVGRTTVAFVPFRGDTVDHLALTPDARMLIQRNKDGTFAIHDVRRGVPVTEFSYSSGGRMDLGSAQTAVLYGRYADDEIVVWTSSGYFDATYEGAAQVFLRFAGLPDLYTFDQFATIMRRPDLAALVMRGAFKDEPITYRAPPTVAGSMRSEADQILVALRQTSGNRLARILLFQDGLHTDDLPMLAEQAGLVGGDGLALEQCRRKERVIRCHRRPPALPRRRLRSADAPAISEPGCAPPVSCPAALRRPGRDRAGAMPSDAGLVASGRAAFFLRAVSAIP